MTTREALSVLKMGDLEGLACLRKGVAVKQRSFFFSVGNEICDSLPAAENDLQVAAEIRQ